MNWIILTAIVAGFGMYNFLVKLASGKFSSIVILMIVSGTALVFSAITSLMLKLSGQDLSFSKTSIHLPVLAGVAYGLALFLYSGLLTKGLSVSVGSPITNSGTMLVATMLGVIFLKEPVTGIKILGLILTISGIFFLSK